MKLTHVGAGLGLVVAWALLVAGFLKYPTTGLVQPVVSAAVAGNNLVVNWAGTFTPRIEPMRGERGHARSG